MRKQAEAKMSEALDRSRIMNISIAEPPTTPALPTTSPITKLVVGFCLALFIAIGLVFVADYWDPSFRTPYEIETVLEVPVLAAIPHPKALGGKGYMIELPGKTTS
jgi:capsular polysaccharide biosynthesis protein